MATNTPINKEFETNHGDVLVTGYPLDLAGNAPFVCITLPNSEIGHTSFDAAQAETFANGLLKILAEMKKHDRRGDA